MDAGRAIAPWSGMLQRAVALCVLAAGLPFAGCRSTEGPGEPPAQFGFTAGDRMVYDGWALNVLGFTIDSTRTRITWEILSTTASVAGYSNSIMVGERALRLSNNTVTADTFFLRLTPGGSVLRYGFLADLVRRREGRTIPRRWDTLAVPDLQFWTVGTMDSAGEMVESATAPGNEDYFNVLVDSVSSIFAARRVEMDGERLQATLWISSNPSCFPRLEEEPDPYNGITEGSLLILRELRQAAGTTSSDQATGGPGSRFSALRTPPGP